MEQEGKEGHKGGKWVSGKTQGILLSIIYGLLKPLKHMMAGFSTEREIKRMKGQITV